MNRGITRKVLRQADYLATLEAMRAFTNTRTDDTPDELWQVEHPAIFTLGQAGKEEHILNAGNIPVIRTERGGQVTYHGPGQVVIYTLVDIRRQGLLVKDTVLRLEQAMINTLADFNTPDASRKPDAPGVYVPDGEALSKIGAIGLKVSRGRIYHGIALNVCMDLGPFSAINPCGYAGLRTVDMATMGISADWLTVADRLCDHIEIQLNQ
ncbi:MAG: lipoyl(octanoyl) transferase LipB [Burkholderiaceae bacterium]|nr:lipoyl(octanoyl) transferase LipB [Burkholderiaceae bacterium]